MHRYDTRLLTCFQQLNRLTLLMPVVLLLAFGLSATELSAQSSATPTNVYVPLTTPNLYEALEVNSYTCLAELLGACLTGGACRSGHNLIDRDVSNAATAGALSLGTNWVEVVDNDATGTEFHPAGNYAGFVVG